jgi:small subunit ribosomal protein S6
MKMKKYEGLFILKSNLTDEENGKLVNSILDVIAKNGGKVDAKEDLGTRDLAYNIKKEKKGRYLLVYFTAEASAIASMEKTYKINESILRTVVFINEAA